MESLKLTLKEWWERFEWQHEQAAAVPNITLLPALDLIDYDSLTNLAPLHIADRR